MSLSKDMQSITCLSPLIEKEIGIKLIEALDTIDFQSVLAETSMPIQDDLVYQMRAEYKGKEILIDLHLLLDDGRYRNFSTWIYSRKHALLADNNAERLNRGKKSFNSSVYYCSEIPVVSVSLFRGPYDRCDKCLVKLLLERTGCNCGIKHEVKKALTIQLEYFEKNRRKMKEELRADLYQFLLIHANFEAFKAEFPSEDKMHQNVVGLFKKISEASRVSGDN